MPTRVVKSRSPCLTPDWKPDAVHGGVVADELLHIAFFDDRARPNIEGMLLAARQPNASHVRFHAVLSRPLHVPGMRVTLLRPLPPLARCLYDGLAAISHGPGPHYLYKPLLHLLLPREVRRVVVLDTDVVPLRDLRLLLAEWQRDAPRSLIGIANEQSRYYQKGSGGRLVGKNGGVQLLDLAGMRSSAEYAAALDEHASGRGGRWIGWLGDQTLYTFLAADRPQLVHTIGCEWNRQLNARFGFRNADSAEVHACPRRCGALHANDASTIRCVATLMQRDPSCRTWRGLAANLTSASSDAPRPTCVGRRMSPRRAADFGAAIRRFFPDCCVPHGLTGFRVSDAP